MSRKPVQRNLPDLAQQLSTFEGFHSASSKSAQVADALQPVALRLQHPQPRPFYSMREVALAFKVTLPVVSRAYRQLEKEGLLIRRRGSRTDLAPLNNQTQTRHRGVVVIPIWMPAFLIFHDWRTFFTQLEAGLRKHQFIPHLVFAGVEESVHPDFAERLIRFDPNYVIWLTPFPADRNTEALIADRGIRTIVLNKDPNIRFRGDRYLLSWSEGLQKVMESWKSEGIRRIDIPWSSGPRHSSTTANPESLLKKMGLEVFHSQPGPLPWEEYLDTLGHEPDTGILLDEDIWWAELCAQAPRRAADLFRRSRVLATRPVNLPSRYLQSARTDTLFHNWSDIARILCDDLDSGSVFTYLEPRILEAEWTTDRPAEELAPHYPGNTDLALF